MMQIPWMRRALTLGYQLGEESPGSFAWRDRNGAGICFAASQEDALAWMAERLAVGEELLD